MSNGYLEHKIYEGKTGKYNIVKVTCSKMDEHTSPSIKNDFSLYFSDRKNLGEKTCLDLSNVNYIGVSGLSAILVFNVLNKNATGTKDKTALFGLNEGPKKLMVTSQLDFVFNIKDSVNNL